MQLRCIFFATDGSQIVHLIIDALYMYLITIICEKIMQNFDYKNQNRIYKHDSRRRFCCTFVMSLTYTYWCLGLTYSSSYLLHWRKEKHLTFWLICRVVNNCRVHNITVCEKLLKNYFFVKCKIIFKVETYILNPKQYLPMRQSKRAFTNFIDVFSTKMQLKVWMH